MARLLLSFVLYVASSLLCSGLPVSTLLLPVFLSGPEVSIPRLRSDFRKDINMNGQYVTYDHYGQWTMDIINSLMTKKIYFVGGGRRQGRKRCKGLLFEGLAVKNISKYIQYQTDLAVTHATQLTAPQLEKLPFGFTLTFCFYGFHSLLEFLPLEPLSVRPSLPLI